MKPDVKDIKWNDIKFNHRLVVKFYDHFLHHTIYQNKKSLLQNDDLLWQDILKQFPSLQVNKLFTSLSPEKIYSLITKAKDLDPLYKPPDLLKYYNVVCPAETDLRELIDSLMKVECVELTYIQGKGTNTSVYTEMDQEKALQGYLNPAPEGIDAKYAWEIEGGRGKGTVKFIDIEQGWKLDNERNNIETLPLTGINEKAWEDHGAAVLGIITGGNNNTDFGITPGAAGYVISPWRPDGSPNDADAILSAISYLNYGDIILIESQSYHSNTLNKLWPVEIHEASFQSIRLATALGIIVIEAAGNGDLYSGIGNDLDMFTSDGKRILYAAGNDFKDSGAILVAAASNGLPHIRNAGSNYGSRMNCYAWEECLADVRFKKLRGTSGASAIIAGAAIAIQSISAAKNNVRLGPQQMRAIFSNELYGTPSANGHEKDKIGVMPDLKKIIEGCLNIYPA